MAYRRDITEDDRLFFDTDRTLRFPVYSGEPSDDDIAAGNVIPVDVTGWTLVWVLKKLASSATALITKTVGSGIAITGTYDSDPSVNTQRIAVSLDNTDTYDVSAGGAKVKPGTYEYALKRLDAGSETILAYGTLELLQASAWE